MNLLTIFTLLSSIFLLVSSLSEPTESQSSTYNQTSEHGPSHPGNHSHSSPDHPRPPRDPRTFRLRADTKAPAPINTLGFVTTGLGFSRTPGAPWRGFIEPYGNRTEPGQEGWGKLHDAMAPGNIVYLRPTHGTPMYFVLEGDPQSDPTPALTLWDSWAVIRSTVDGREFLGMGQWTGGWMGCYGKETGEYRLYVGPQIGSDGGPCTVTFSLEVVWDRR